MASGPQDARPQRTVTDDSLRAERESSDAEAALQGRVEERADRVVDRARERADAVLGAARDQADGREAVARTAVEEATLAAGRTLEDEILERERAEADERLRRERAERARVLAILRPLQRQRTDRDLLTERTRSDDQLAHRDDFLGMVSHDLRNLLCAIVMEASELSELASASAEGRRTATGLKRVELYAARMSGLIGDLVDIVSIDAGKLSVQPTRQDAAAILLETVETYLPAASEKGISLLCVTPDTALPAYCDSGRVLQILTNLVSNALKFTARGGSIVIRGERAADGLTVSVSDTGIGIPAEQLERVFERFWQVGKDDRRGLGLGLNISRWIVEAHGGKIWAESVPGSGSTLRFTLPDEVAPAT
jgi:signal transduction histidine kinase